STSALAGGASQAESATVTVPTTPGTYYVWVIADNLGNVTNQSNTSNDEQRSVAFTVAQPPTLSVSNIPNATSGQQIALSSLVTVSDPSGVGYQKLELWDSNGTAATGQFLVNGVAESGRHNIDVTSTDYANTFFDVGTLGGSDVLWAQLVQNNGQTTAWQSFTVTASPPPPPPPPPVAQSDLLPE